MELFHGPVRLVRWPAVRCQGQSHGPASHTPTPPDTDSTGYQTPLRGYFFRWMPAASERNADACRLYLLAHLRRILAALRQQHLLFVGASAVKVVKQVVLSDMALFVWFRGAGSSLMVQRSSPMAYYAC